MWVFRIGIGLFLLAFIGSRLAFQFDFAYIGLPVSALLGVTLLLAGVGLTFAVLLRVLMAFMPRP